MTTSLILSVVAIAFVSIAGAVAALVWGPQDQKAAIATMILASMPATITALIAAFKSTEAKEVAAVGVAKVETLQVQVDGRLSALIAANERAFVAEKLVARQEGRDETIASAVEETRPDYTDLPKEQDGLDTKRSV